jgi:simple sugar transport system permease protein
MAERAEAGPLDGPLTELMRRMRGGVPGGLGGLSALFVALVVVCVVIVPGFASVGTVQSVMFQMPELGLLSLAMVVPLISGGLNLAIIATANQAALLMAWLMKIWFLSAGASASGGEVTLIILGAMAAGLVLCIVWGLITGVIVAYTGVHPILVTLGTKSLIDGISIYLTRGTIISGLPPQYATIGNETVFGIPVSFIVLLVTALCVGLLMRRTPFGVSVFMVGSNIEATRYSAIDTRRVLVGVYLTSAVLCFVAASLMLARFNSASADYAQSYLLITILAAVLGGVDPNGGFGKVAGLILALAILQVLASGSNLLGFSDYLKMAVWGLVLIGVMAAQTMHRVFNERRRA